MTIFQDLQEVATLFGGELNQSPVVQHQQAGLGQAGQKFGVTSIALGDGQLRQEPRQAQVLSGVAFAAGLVRQGAGDPGFADAGREGDILLINGLMKRRFTTVITRIAVSKY